MWSGRLRPLKQLEVPLPRSPTSVTPTSHTRKILLVLSWADSELSEPR